MSKSPRCFSLSLNSFAGNKMFFNISLIGFLANNFSFRESFLCCGSRVREEGQGQTNNAPWCQPCRKTTTKSNENFNDGISEPQYQQAMHNVTWFQSLPRQHNEGKNTPRGCKILKETSTGFHTHNLHKNTTQKPEHNKTRNWTTQVSGQRSCRTTTTNHQVELMPILILIQHEDQGTNIKKRSCTTTSTASFSVPPLHAWLDRRIGTVEQQREGRRTKFKTGILYK